MNPAILARLFQAHADALTDGQPQQGDSFPLQQEPGDLWGPRGNTGDIDLSQPQQSDPGAMDARSTGDMTLPPSDYQYLDRVEGDGPPLGVMFGQQAGEPMGAPTNVPMNQLPPGAQEGQYISPLDMQPPSGRMGLGRR